jgi:hypothetical protein
MSGGAAVEEFAARLHGREYGSEIAPEEERAAKAAGLVVVFGASDDLVEFRGAIHDEVGAYDGTTALIADGRLWQSECDNDGRGCPYAERAEREARARGVEVEARWCAPGEDASWTFDARRGHGTVPHATFDVMEDGDVFCRGIVFELPR